MVKTDLTEILLALSLVLPACSGRNPSDTDASAGPGSGAGGASSGNGQGGASVAFGAACGGDSVCSSALCMSEASTGWPGGFCSAKCNTSEPTCEGTGRCFDVGESMGVCLMSCTMTGNECRAGYACSDLSGDGSFYACLPACSEDAQCTTLGSCDPTRRLCVGKETDCNNATDDDGDGLIDCEDESSCKGTAACTPGNTATGQACSAPTDCKAGSGKPVCLSEAVAGYPKGYCSEYCNLAANDCSSPGAVCLNRHLQSGNGMCYLSCNTAADCPAAGYQCTSAGGGKKVCMPACTGDDQCEGNCNLDFGLCTSLKENCSDSADNDNDRSIDCEDLDCAASCRPQISAACSGLVVAQASIEGDTKNGSKVLSGSCTGSGAHERIFTFTPGAVGQRGALELTLKSATDQGLYVRTSCDDKKAELGCSDRVPGGKDEKLVVPVVGGAPVSIIVDSYNAANAGPFTLLTSFREAICGDAANVLPEECDDGNTVSGDGCDMNCRVEPAFYCAKAIVAHMGVNEGETASGTNAFRGSCTGDGGKEKIYTYTPERSGMLHLELSSMSQLGVYIRTACADAAAEIACAGFLAPNVSQVIDAPVEAGMPLAIIVDGQAPSAIGTFTLKMSIE